MKSSDEFKEFESLAGDVPDTVDNGLKKTGTLISVELQRSRGRFFVSFVVLSVFGYFCSLAMCSQYSIALTQFSIDVASVLHQLPDPWCPIVCGIVFSLLPVLCLLIFLDRFQRRHMIAQYWWLPVLSTCVTCLLMYFLPSSLQHQGMHSGSHHLRQTQGDVVWLMWWMMSAVSVPLFFLLSAKLRIKSRFKGV